jgi:hypothetical protein
MSMERLGIVVVHDMEIVSFARGTYGFSPVCFVRECLYAAQARPEGGAVNARCNRGSGAQRNEGA